MICSEKVPCFWATLCNAKRYTTILLACYSVLLPTYSESLERTVKEQKRYEYGIARDAHAQLERWVADGSAAGLDGTVWDNRDDGHSTVNLDQLPGMERHMYSKADARTRGWGLQLQTRDNVTVGNSSTAHKQIDKGSQPRCAYSLPSGLSALRKQYTSNNLYIYPSHMDHIAGNIRKEKKQTKKWGNGHGDMYPTNTPYLIITQGSSGTDQPFIRAVGWTIGSFPKAVRKKLEAQGLLMPTVQSLMRLHQKNVSSREDYLSGQAHPAVFDRRNLDALQMMQAAHEMRPESIPPLVQLQVLSEDNMRAGYDFIGPPLLTEKHFTSPEVIARIWRGYPQRRVMQLSAKDTINPSGARLKYHWVVLRGPTDKVKITPLAPDHSEVQVEIEYPGRTESTWIDGMWSNRLDIGVFAESSQSISAPAFLTWMTLDNEQRDYDQQGNLQSIDYGTGRYVDPRLAVGMPFRDEFQYTGGKISGVTRNWKDGRQQIVQGGSRPEATDLRNAITAASKTAPSPELSSAKQPAKPSQRTVSPTLSEREAAMQRLSSSFNLELPTLLRRSTQMQGVDLYVTLNHIIRQAAASGDAQTSAIAYERLSREFTGDFEGCGEQALAQLAAGSKEHLTPSDVRSLCLMAIRIHQDVAGLDDMGRSQRIAQLAVSLARRTDDIPLQRDVIREVSLSMP